MRPTRLSMLIASTLLAALLLVPTALAGTAIAAQVSFGPAANVATGDGPASVEVHTQGRSLSPTAALRLTTSTELSTNSSSP